MVFSVSQQLAPRALKGPLNRLFKLFPASCWVPTEVSCGLVDCAGSLLMHAPMHLLSACAVCHRLKSINSHLPWLSDLFTNLCSKDDTLFSNVVYTTVFQQYQYVYATVPLRTNSGSASDRHRGPVGTYHFDPPTKHNWLPQYLLVYQCVNYSNHIHRQIIKRIWMVKIVHHRQPPALY